MKLTDIPLDPRALSWRGFGMHQHFWEPYAWLKNMQRPIPARDSAIRDTIKKETK